MKPVSCTMHHQADNLILVNNLIDRDHHEYQTNITQHRAGSRTHRYRVKYGCRCASCHSVLTREEIRAQHQEATAGMTGRTRSVSHPVQAEMTPSSVPSCVLRAVMPTKARVSKHAMDRQRVPSVWAVAHVAPGWSRNGALT